MSISFGRITRHSYADRDIVRSLMQPAVGDGGLSTVIITCDTFPPTPSRVFFHTGRVASAPSVLIIEHPDHAKATLEVADKCLSILDLTGAPGVI